MPPELAMCLCLVIALFSGALVGLSYAQLKLPDPMRDGFFNLQNDLASRFGMESWAAIQRSKAARWVSFIVSLMVLVGSVIGAAVYGASAFAIF